MQAREFDNLHRFRSKQAIISWQQQSSASEIKTDSISHWADSVKWLFNGADLKNLGKYVLHVCVYGWMALIAAISGPFRFEMHSSEFNCFWNVLNSWVLIIECLIFKKRLTAYFSCFSLKKIHSYECFGFQLHQTAIEVSIFRSLSLYRLHL